MTNIIEIKNFSYRYHDNFVFDKFNLQVKQGEWLSIIGPNGSGKSTLVKALVGLLPSNEEIKFNNVILSKITINEIRKNISVVFENIDNQFIMETVQGELSFLLQNRLNNQRVIDKKISLISSKLKIEHLLNRIPNSLSGGEKQKVALACALVTNPQILIIDESLTMIDKSSQEEILKFLKLMQKDEGLTIINLTHNLEESYYSDRVVVLNSGNILLEGTLKEILVKDRLLNRIGIEIPFMIDLSLKLKLYDLIDDVIFDIDEMVDLLWK